MNSTILNLESVVIEGIIPEGLGNGNLPISLVGMGITDEHVIKAAQLLEDAAYRVASRFGYVSEISIMDDVAPSFEGWTYFHDERGVDSSRRVHESGAEAGLGWNNGCWCFYITPAKISNVNDKYEDMAEELGY